MKALGASLVAVSPQTPDRSLSVVEKDELEFEVLSDAGNGVARRFGLAFALLDYFRERYLSRGLDIAAYNGDSSYELPVTGTYVIGRDGVIRLAYVDLEYRNRLEPQAILDCLEGLAAGG